MIIPNWAVKTLNISKIIIFFKERGGKMVWGAAEVAAVVLAVTLAVTLTLLIALLVLFIYERRSPLVVYSADPS